MMNLTRLLATIVIFGFSMGHSAEAEDIKKASFSCKPVDKVVFDRNSTSAHFGGFLQRLREECFAFYAKRGQILEVDIADFNDSTGMTIYKPGYKINYGNYTDDDKYAYGWGDSRIPLNTYSGETVTLPPEKQESSVQKYAGRLHETGTYLIVIGLSGADASRWGGTISIK